MRKALLVLNPAAGGHGFDTLRQALARHIAGRGIRYCIYETSPDERIDEAIRKRVGEGFDMIAVVGGDGTVSGVAGGLVGTSVPLGIIPTGTGNILARELDIPLNTERALRLIAGDHHIRKIDAMRVGDRTFILNIGVGISALTVRDTAGKDKSRFGMLAYVWTAFIKIFQFRPRRFTLTVDGKVLRIRSPEVAIANSGIIGTMLLPDAPDIRIDDGALDLCIVRAHSIRDYPVLVLNILARRPLRRSVRCLKASSSITIETERPLLVQADGEIAGRTPITVDVLPGAVGVIVPPDR